MPKSAWSCSAVRGFAAGGPGGAALDGVGDEGLLGGVRRALVELHGDVGAEILLDAHVVLGRPEVLGAVEDGAELDAVVGELERVGEAEDLEAARVGEDGAVPVHERVQAAGVAHDVSAGAQVRGGRCWRAAPARRCRPSCGVVTPLTVARVPTGMNTGVSTGPCAVWKRPRRAEVVASRARSSKSKSVMRGIVPGRTSRPPRTAHQRVHCVANHPLPAHVQRSKMTDRPTDDAALLAAARDRRPRRVRDARSRAHADGLRARAPILW